MFRPMADWVTYEALAPRILLHHPATTQDGQPIKIDADGRFGRQRVHLIAPDRSEVYFELVVYPDPLDIERVLVGQRSFLVEQDETKTDVVMSEPRTAQLLGRPARQVDVEFTDHDGRFSRLFSFLNFQESAEPWGLRVIYDPTSPVNGEILSRLEVGP